MQGPPARIANPQLMRLVCSSFFSKVRKAETGIPLRQQLNAIVSLALIIARLSDRAASCVRDHLSHAPSLYPVCYLSAMGTLSALPLAAYFSAISPQSIFRVQTDLEFRSKWDSYCVEVSKLGRHDGWEIVYWEVSYPWPLSNRDYVYARRSHEPTAGSYVIVQRACELGEHRAERNNVVRVCTYTSDVLITPDGPSGGCKMKIMYQDDPRGRIPKSLVNWAAKQGFANAMSDLARAGQLLEHET